VPVPLGLVLGWSLRSRGCRIASYRNRLLAHPYEEQILWSASTEPQISRASPCLPSLKKLVRLLVCALPLHTGEVNEPEKLESEIVKGGPAPIWNRASPILRSGGPRRGGGTRFRCGNLGHVPQVSARPEAGLGGLLRKTFAVDVFSCPRCGGRRRVLAFLTQGSVIRRILRHLHLPELPPPQVPARGPAQQALWE
jgi:hypothetical protein